MRIIRPAALALFCLVLFASSCGESKPPIRIAISSWAGVEIAELASRLGLYAKHGVNARMIRFSAYSDSISAFREDKVEAGMHTMDDAIRYAAAGKDARIVLLTDSSYGGDGLVAARDIPDLASLKGRRVGVEVGTVGHYSLLRILEKAGLGLDDITVVSIPAWEIEDAFVARTIDAGVTWEPYLFRSAQRGGGHVLITSRDYPETIITCMVFDAATVRSRPQDVQRVIDAYFEAFDVLQNDPAKAYAVMAEAEGISPAEFAAHAEGLTYFDLPANLRMLGKDGPAYALARDMAAFIHKNGVISTVPHTAGFLDGEFVKAAAQKAR